MKRLIILGCLLFSQFSFAQEYSAREVERPKLVVGIVVDQMRQEYFYRFHDRYVEGGLKRLMHDGFMMQNGHYNYIPTYTGPGHASVYTGTTPATHGIIGNNWYIRATDTDVYCAEDSLVTAVGGSEGNGKISPKNLLSSTITDELRFATGKRSKVVGVAIKDRGAALPAGHLGDAYWYDSKTGGFMTSSYYHEELPSWVEEFNNKKLVSKYLDQTWETLFPIETYIQGAADDNEFESPFKGKDRPTFPYDLKKLQKDNGGLGMISSIPFGNTFTVEMALAAIEGEQLGKRGETDFLAVSFSSPDYIGHRFGPQAIEVEDNYLRLDRDLARFFDYLDREIGKGEYLVFLTADHGVADVVNYMKSERMVTSGSLDSKTMLTELDAFVGQKYGSGDWISSFSNQQIFLNRELVSEKDLSLVEMQRAVADFLLRFDGVKETYIADDLRRYEYTTGFKHLLQMGYNHKSSGDVMVIMEPAWLANASKGTTHGTGYTYDTNVPIVFYGWGVKPGSSSRYATVTDIAPTLSMMLKTRLPNGATGQPIGEIVDAK
ncbi:alkaline phosphatase PafA [uncultured Cyclobacterium sp.]|uniref:alkaline phosphatase PafA n=1 Tax=uncultured Cyclobacterium sp. TaxID=453820 RepID=UPI0030ED80DA|tara:strand:+ start:192553 stop:194196 length:1644 start_codon:yes stop_codon:yes gene_type:complete